jgi:IS30 family transposase
MNAKNYKRITLEERYKIEALLSVHKSTREIATILNRPRSTIHREIQRGKQLPGSYYTAIQANMHAEFYKKVRRIDTKLRSVHGLRIYVLRKLKDGWSPEQISNRICIDYPNNEKMRISYESIYKYIYCETQGRLQTRLIKLLPYNKPKRQGGKRREIYMGKIIDRVSIDKRPDHIEKREEVGHWEGDLVIGRGQTSAIGTLVERKLRYTIIVPLKSRKSKDVVKAFAKEIMKLPPSVLKTLTYDNGIEMAAHKDFTRRTKMDVYFAHPYSSWERGTNENTNGLIRRVLKKKTNFNRVTTNQLKELQSKLNNRPRKILGYKTPNEMLRESCA